MDYNGIPNEYMIYGSLFALSNRIQTMGDGVFEEVTVKQHFLMICLSVFEHIPTLKETAEFMGCSYQNVKRMAVSLEGKGYVKIVRDKEDKRAQRIMLLTKVKELERKKEVESNAFMELMFQNISQKDIEVTMRTIMQMNENVKKS